MDNLSDKKCIPCEGGALPLTPTAIAELLGKISGWEVKEDTEIFKKFAFKNFREVLEFVNKVGELAESEGHHPNIYMYDYKFCKITLSTHSIGGLSQNDFILAAKIDLI